MPPSPIIIGATGGSGTRVVHTIVAKQNIYMGHPLNAENDSAIIASFLETHINPILEQTRSLNYQPEDLPEPLLGQTMEALKTAIAELRSHQPEGAAGWGFKNPRSVYILPLLKALHPDLFFVHVVRDGRDIALSSNRNQPRKHFRAAFPQGTLDPESPEAAIRLWAKVNLETERWCHEHLAGRYHQMRYEALCENPQQEIEKLYDALGLPRGAAKEHAELVQTPKTLGRWRGLSAPEQALLEFAAKEALRTYNYL